MGVDYLEDGILFCGHFLTWVAGVDEIRVVAEAVAPRYWVQTGTVERILNFELKNLSLAPTPF